jgi:AcrR family transcriptional regulator
VTEPAPPRVDPSRYQRRKNRTADHLAATAFGLFEAKGYEAVTMEQIAAAADVAKGTLYNHFPVKEALLAHQFREEIASGMAAIHGAMERQSTFAARMKHVLRASAEWNNARRAYLPHYLRFRMAEIGTRESGPVLDEQRSGVYQILEALFRAGQHEGGVRSDLAPRQLAWLFEFMCLGAVVVWLNHPGDDLKKRFELALEVLLNGIAPPATRLKKKKKK